MAKKKRMWELEMVGEWVSQTFPDARWQTNVRVGKAQPRLPDGQYDSDEAKMLGLWRRQIDAIVFLPDRLLLVEAMLRANPGKLAVLKLYERLLAQTPELAEFSHLPVEKVLLYAIEDPTLNVVAREEGILPVRFVPSFFEKWFDKLRGRDKRAPLSTFASRT